jgi:DNA topoisomerase-1
MNNNKNSNKNKNKILLLVESPAKCGTIVGHLGADKYVCAATFGHLRELTGLQDIDPTFAAVPQFHAVDSKSAQIAKIRALVAECKETYLMTDNDREGAGIAYHACCLFGLPVATTKRILFNEITKPALERAIQAPQPLNMDAVHAQIARQALDMLVGFKITPTLWSHVRVVTSDSGSGSALSAGRCQTPALRLIYDNQRDIDAAQGCIAFETVGYFTKLNLKYELSRGHGSAEACAAFLHASAAFEHVIRAPETRGFVKAAPLPMTTCSLQQQASNELGFSPADTMQACQHLYEGGYITYPRTDSRAYSEPFLQHAGAYIAERWGEDYAKVARTDEPVKPLKKHIVVKKKKTVIKDVDVDVDVDVDELVEPVAPVRPQEAHEAVHVTSLHCAAVPDTMTAKEQRLYRMIWRHSAESCMAPCTGKTLTSCISAPEQREYRHSVERTDFAGWRIVSPAAKTDDLGVWSFFQAITPNAAIKYNKLQSRMHLRELKSHYSEASLVSMLEERGIGRPSTFSSLVHKIQERGYVAKQDVPGRRVNCMNYELDGGILSQFAEEREFGNEKNRLVIQPLGKAVIEFLCSHFAELFDYDYTKRMEQQLDQVSSGQKKWGDVCADCLSCVDRLLALVPPTKMGDNQANQAANQSNSKSTEKNLCKLLGKYNGADLFLRTGRYGPYLTWGDQKHSLSHLKNGDHNANVDGIPITYDEAIRCITNDKGNDKGNNTNESKTGSSILREINAYTSVRSGQYGPYIYYKNAKMKTPAFVSLRGFKEDWKTCDLQLLDMWSTMTPVKGKK